MRTVLFSLLIISSLPQIFSVGHTETLKARIKSVTDGDTLKVLFKDGERTIRLACIDAPETKQSSHGIASTRRLRNLLPPGENVVVQAVENDRYDRLVGIVFLNNISINVAMVQEGQAFVYPKYLSNCPDLQDKLLQAQNSAKNRRIGVWAQDKPLMPWDFRDNKNQDRETVQNPTVVLKNKNCDPSYPDFCLPPGIPDLDCGGIKERRFRVLLPDPHRFDGDKDGIGCE